VRRAAAPADPVVRARLVRLHREIGHRDGPWGGALLEPDVVRRLAEQPPRTESELADVPGVGPSLAARHGGVILRALGSVATQSAETGPQPPLRESLERWRGDAARAMGVAGFRVLSDAALLLLASGRIRDRVALARLPGVGPRFIEKFGVELLDLVAKAG
jgi:hypothetical protein